MENAKDILHELQKEVKLGVVWIDLLLTIYVCWLIITNTSSWVPGALLGLTPLGSYMLLRASKLFNLCIFHKLMIMHANLVYYCCLYQANYGFGITLPYMRWLMFLIGLWLLYNIIIRRYCKNKTTGI